MIIWALLAVSVSPELHDFRLDDLRITGDPVRIEAVVHGRNSSKDILPDFVDFKDANKPAFDLEIDGEVLAKTKVEDFAQTQRKMAFMLVLDVSGSMAGETCARMIRVAMQFAEKVKPSPVGVVTAGDEVKVLKPMNSEQPEFSAFFAGQTCSDNKTHLFQAAARAIATVASPTLPSPRHVIILSDGADDSSGKAFSRNDVVLAAQTQSVALHTVAFKTRFWKQDIMAKLALDGGGTAHKATSPDELNTAFEKIRMGFEQSAVASSPLPIKVQDGKQHEVTISVIGHPNFFVRRQLRIPKAPPAKPAIKTAKINKRQNGSSRLLWVLIAAGLVLAFVMIRRRRSAARLETERQLADKDAEAALRAQQAMAADQSALVESEVSSAAAEPSRSSPTVISRHLSQAWLEVIEGAEVPGQRVDLNEGETLVVGSADDAQLVFNAVGLSGHHAELRFEHGSVWVHDMGSTNGTWIAHSADAQPIQLTVRTQASPGARLTLGPLVLLVRGS